MDCTPSSAARGGRAAVTGVVTALVLALVMGVTAVPAVAQSVPQELSLLCVEREDKVVQATAPSDCSRREVAIQIPETRPVHLCGRDDFGLVRFTTDPADCTRDHEFPITIPDGGPVILCSKNIKNGRIQPRGELRFADDVARCDSQFYTPFITPAAPLAVDDAVEVDEDTRLVVPAGGVLDNDADASGGPLTARLVEQPEVGAVVLAADGGFTYDPRGLFDDLTQDETRVVSFRYATSDGKLESAPATATITVIGRNDRPAPVADTLTTDEDTALEVLQPGVLGNDIDAEEDLLTAHLVDDVPAGTLRLDADGGLRYDPAGAFEHLGDGEQAEIGFSYVARDGADDSDPVTVTIAVTGVNDTPVATADAFTTDENTPLVITAAQLVANDTDAEGAPLTPVDLIAGSPAEAISPQADGSVRIDPRTAFDHLEDGQVGTARFTYAAADGALRSDRVEVVVTVTGISPPRAVDDSAVTDEDTPIEVAVLRNDLPADGVLEVDATSQRGAALSVQGDVVTYDPRGAFDDLQAGSSRIDTATYRLRGVEGVATATIRVQVDGRDDAPVAADDLFGPVPTAGTTVLDVLANDTDVDTPRSGLSVVLVSQPDRGRLTLRPDGLLDFDPAGDLADGDRTTFRYRTADGTSESATATAVLDTALDSPPTILDQLLILLADSAPADAALQVVASDATGPVIFDLAVPSELFAIDAGGILRLVDQTAIPPLGSYPLRVRVTDTAGQTAVATVTVLVVLPFDPTGEVFRAIGNVPLVAGAVDAVEGIAVRDARGLLDNDGQPDALELIPGDRETTLGGSAQVEPDGRFTYLPPRPRATTPVAGCDPVVSHWDGTPGAVDTFTYLVQERREPGEPAPVAEEVTVQLVLEDVVWVIDPEAAAVGCGTALRPHRDLTAFAAAGLDGPGEAIAVLRGTATGGIDLKAGQRLVGGHVDLLGGGNPDAIPPVAPLLLRAGDPGTPAGVAGTVGLDDGVDVRLTHVIGDAAGIDGAALVAGDAVGVEVAEVRAGAGGTALALGAATAEVAIDLLASAAGGPGGAVLALAGTHGVIDIAAVQGGGPVELQGGGAPGPHAAVGLGDARIEAARGVVVEGWDGIVRAGVVDVATTGQALTVADVPATGRIEIDLLRARSGSRPTGGIAVVDTAGDVVVARAELPTIDLGVAGAHGVLIDGSDGTVVVGAGTLAAVPVPAGGDRIGRLVEVRGGAPDVRIGATASLGTAADPAATTDVGSLLVTGLADGAVVRQTGAVVDRGVGLRVLGNAPGAAIAVEGPVDVATTGRPALLAADTVLAMTGQVRLSSADAPAVHLRDVTAGAAGLRVVQASSTASPLVAGSAVLTGLGIDIDGLRTPAGAVARIEGGQVIDAAVGGVRLADADRVVLGAVSVTDPRDEAGDGSGIGVEVVGGERVVLQGTVVQRSAGTGVLATGQRDLVLDRVAVSDALGVGVDLPDPAGTTRITGTTIQRSSQGGLRLTATGAPTAGGDPCAVTPDRRITVSGTAIGGTRDTAAGLLLDAGGGTTALSLGAIGTTTAVFQGLDAVQVAARDGAGVCLDVQAARLGASDRDALRLRALGEGSAIRAALTELRATTGGGLAQTGAAGLSAQGLLGGVVSGSLSQVDVIDFGTSGIELLDAAGDVSFARVLAAGSGRSAILLQRVSGTVIDLTDVVGAPRVAGIELHDVSGVRVQRSDVELTAVPGATGGHGIFVHGGSEGVAVDDVRVRRTAGDGIRVESSRAVDLTDLEVAATLGTGVRIVAAQDVRLVLSTLDGDGGDDGDDDTTRSGVVVEDAAPVLVEDVSVRGYDGAAVAVDQQALPYDEARCPYIGTCDGYRVDLRRLTLDVTGHAARAGVTIRGSGSSLPPTGLPGPQPQPGTACAALEDVTVTLSDDAGGSVPYSGGVPFTFDQVRLAGYNPPEPIEDWLQRNRNTPAIGSVNDVGSC